MSRCQENLEFRAKVIEACKRDVIFFCNTFLVAHNPREGGTVPFVLFDEQEKALHWIDERQRNKQHGTIPKSRYCGATNLSVAYMLHRFLFFPEFDGAVVSRTRDMADKLGDINSILEKSVAFMDKLPSWLKPKPDKIIRKRGLIKNLGNGSSMMADGGINALRGARATIVFIDECAFIEGGYQLYASVSEVADTVILVSTPNGTSNLFYEQVTNKNVASFRYHWTADPRRTHEWYQNQVLTKPKIIVAQELDISFEASGEDSFIPHHLVKTAIESHHKIPELQRYLEDETIRYQAGYDVAGGGVDSSVLIFRKECVVTDVLHWKDLDVTQSTYKVHDELQARMAANVNYDSVGVGEAATTTFLHCPSYTHKYTYNAINGASSAPENLWIDGEGISKDYCLNLRAYIWATLRERFRKTYEMVNGIATHPIDELISIPNDPDLIRQISEPKLLMTSTGKIQVESKILMKKRGAKSPDRADALAYCFHEEGGSIFDYL